MENQQQTVVESGTPAAVSHQQPQEQPQQNVVEMPAAVGSLPPQHFFAPPMPMMQMQMPMDVGFMPMQQQPFGLPQTQFMPALPQWGPPPMGMPGFPQMPPMGPMMGPMPTRGMESKKRGNRGCC